MIEAHGGVGLAKFKSLYQETSLGSDGGATLTVWRESGRFARISRTVVGETRILHDGATAWETDENGYVRNLEPIEARESRMTGALTDFTWNLAHPTSPLGVVSEAETSMGRRLTCTLATGEHVSLFVDPLKGWVKRVEWPEGPGGPWVARFDDYRMIEGLAFPFKISITTGGRTETQTVISLAVNPNIQKSWFAPPSLSLPECLSRPEGPITFPEAFGQQNQVVVPVKLHGRETRFLLDSGAAGTVLNPGLLRWLNTPTVPLGLVQTADNQIKETRLTRLTLIEVGTLAFRDPVVVASPLPPRMPGLLGYQFFHPYPVEINFLTGALIIHSEGGFLLPSGALVLTLSLARRLPTVTGFIPGVGEARLVVDTGFPDGWTFFSRWAERHHLPVDRGHINLDTITLGGTAFKNVRAAILPRNEVETDGLLGMEMLSRMARVVFDYRGRRLILIPRADPTDAGKK